jgi:hypothetical protein
MMDAMARQNEGRTTVLEAVLRHCRGERGYFEWFVACFVDVLILIKAGNITGVNERRVL